VARQRARARRADRPGAAPVGHRRDLAEALLIAAPPEQIPSFKDAKRAFERRYVTGLLRRCDGNISRAARLARRTARTL